MPKVILQHVPMPRNLPKFKLFSSAGFNYPGPELYLSVADRNSSCCCLRSSSSESPLCSILLVFFSRVYFMISTVQPTAAFQSLTLNCSLCSPATANTSGTYSGNPSSLRALSICSAAMVFFASFSAISLASEDMSVMNSTLQSIRRSRASLPNARPDLSPRISVMIFCMVAMFVRVS